MISVKNLFKSFGSFKAVDDLSFDIKPGDVVGFLGPNGAGKSTTMKMLTGFLAPTRGDIRIFDLDFNSQPKAIKKMIGYLPEGAPAYGDMTPLQFLNFIAQIRGYSGSEKQTRIQSVIQQVELQEVLDKPIDNLSKGFKRRVGLAQALIHDPQILILDEPTDGLDPNQKHQVRALIKNLAKDKIVIISTHILEEVSAVCNRVMIIAKGKLLFSGTPDELNRQSRFYGAVTLSFSYKADISELAELEGVAEMVVDPDNGNVTLIPEPNKHILHLVTAHVQRCKLPVDSLFVEQGRLDDVFREITQAEAQKEQVDIHEEQIDTQKEIAQ
ncbi:ABC transporter ATP-binding protein [Paraglaciecola hydrolytica]|uniref:Multidrug ABC transporter ATP-binding protein n=1 Tax=Paraglaciecola hydrolytica TaxID=1799789 RepID=A0A136A0G8_9ALTE|nr:ABC transporter ATP-binding protein [Paraglaciecola hydrolytica]KXI28697.1 multidrug ABC transporter ATP-binding protein [Paraglaciecola hydrolytica]